MKFTLEIDADCPGFKAESPGETLEVAQILRDLAAQLEREESFDFTSGLLVSSAGHSFGQWKWIQS